MLIYICYTNKNFAGEDVRHQSECFEKVWPFARRHCFIVWTFKKFNIGDSDHRGLRFSLNIILNWDTVWSQCFIGVKKYFMWIFQTSWTCGSLKVNENSFKGNSKKVVYSQKQTSFATLTRFTSYWIKLLLLWLFN